jgi:hypothetical protein
MRNAEQPALMNLCNQLRHTVETGEFFPIQIVPGVIDLFDDDQMQTQLIKHFTEQTLTSRILCYTNQRVMQYNDFIRQIRQLPEEYTVGEYLVNNSAIRMKSRMLSVEEELTIQQLSDTTETITLEDGAELIIRRGTLTSRAIGDWLTNVAIPVDRNHFSELLKYYRRKKEWHKYFSLKNTIPDLRQRDAATVHKSQGSTYDTVFVDLTNISTCHNPIAAARMLYVAFTRARSRICLYGNLASKYGGLTL